MADLTLSGSQPRVVFEDTSPTSQYFKILVDGDEMDFQATSSYFGVGLLRDGRYLHLTSPVRIGGPTSSEVLLASTGASHEDWRLRNEAGTFKVQVDPGTGWEDRFVVDDSKAVLFGPITTGTMPGGEVHFYSTATAGDIAQFRSNGVLKSTIEESALWDFSLGDLCLQHTAALPTAGSSYVKDIRFQDSPTTPKLHVCSYSAAGYSWYTMDL